MASGISFGTGGLRETVSCDVCLVYDQVLKTPLALPCGHTFCRRCLVTIKASGQFLCPSCRAQHNVQVEALAVNYSLLNITPLCNSMEYEECITHKDNLSYWCSTCGLPLCSFCLHSSHPQGHSVKLTQTFMQEEKLKLVEKIKTVSSTLKDQKIGLKEDSNNLDTLMKEIFRRNANLQSTAADLNDLIASVQKANSITLIKYLEKAVEDFNITGKLSSSGDEAPAGIMKDSREGAAEAAKPNTLPFQQQGHVTLSQEKRETTQVRRAVIDFRDGRLLLHSLAEPESARLCLQMPSEVFLELSVGERRLGCVYISLWSHMRLAQQFLALCMGTMGPSLIGIKAYKKVRGIIVFKFGVGGNSPYIIRNAQTTKSPLLTNLEWGGPNAKPEAEGYIMRTDGTDGLTFGICTKKHHNLTVHAPFGMVVAGLDVARNAFLHDPVNEVTVTHCGLVLPGLSLVLPQPKDLPCPNSSSVPLQRLRVLRGHSKTSTQRPTDPNCPTQ